MGGDPLAEQGGAPRKEGLDCGETAGGGCQTTGVVEPAPPAPMN